MWERPRNMVVSHLLLIRSYFWYFESLGLAADGGGSRKGQARDKIL